MQKIMYICSTKHQVVNLVPLLVEKIDKIIIFTTQTAKNWTENLIKFLEKRKIEYKNIEVSNEIEGDFGLFTNLIKNEIEKEKNNEIFLNVGGGQKLFAMAIMKSFIDFPNLDAKIVYTEGGSKKLFYIDKNFNFLSKPYLIDLSLEEILMLYGYSLWKNTNKDMIEAENLEIKSKLENNQFSHSYNYAFKAAELLKNESLFEEIFYRKIMNEKENFVELHNIKETVRKILQEKKPAFENLNIIYSPGYDPETIKKKIENLNNISIAKNLLKNVYAPNIYDSFWNSIKNQIINHIHEYIHIPTVKVREKPYSQSEMETITQYFKQIGGNIEFEADKTLLVSKISFAENNGIFFEKMVISQVKNLVDKQAWKNIHQVWINVKTQKGDQNTGIFEAEYDIVIVTKFGTLIILESKSSKFDSKIAKGQERDVMQKSGPYGTAIIVGPLLKKIKSISSDIEREKFYPYIANSLITQALKVENSGLRYWCFDEITENLEKELSQ